ncbi:unnamed protein product [Cylicocyclus nassatus]|uniref:Uncharacterized protein n=1 Tax=Cylicocyclus nassatus TaxID=53992 RepID=A0AA36GIN0_CYLNA|nr:unnamed protein product [Cylicocyclus nassatus]
MFLPMLPIYAAILIIRRKTTSKLRSESISERTLHLHSQLLKALTYQACLPMLFVAGMLMFSVGDFMIPNNPLLQYAPTIMGLIPIFDPLLSLYFIKPYQEWLRRNLICKKSSNTPFIEKIRIASRNET